MRFASKGYTGIGGVPSIEYMETQAQFEKIIELAQQSPKEIDVSKLLERLPDNLQRAGKLAQTISKATVKMINDTSELIDKTNAAVEAGKISPEAGSEILVGPVEAITGFLKKWKAIATGEGFTTFAHNVPMPTPQMFK